MELEDNDPDTLQLKDELDSEWVNLWHKSANKKNTTKKQISFAIIQTRRAILQKSSCYSKKVQ